MGILDARQKIVILRNQLGPHVSAFADYAAGPLWTRAKRTALDLGLNDRESETVAQLTVAATIKALSGAIQQAAFDRQFRSNRDR